MPYSTVHSSYKLSPHHHRRDKVVSSHILSFGMCAQIQKLFIKAGIFHVPMKSFGCFVCRFYIIRYQLGVVFYWLGFWWVTVLKHRGLKTLMFCDGNMSYLSFRSICYLIRKYIEVVVMPSGGHAFIYLTFLLIGWEDILFD